MDPKLIQRTQQWLAAQQQADGSWKPDTQFHQRRRHQSLQHRRAAHHRLHRLVARKYRLPGAGRGEGAPVCRAAHERTAADAYTLAVVANFAADYGKDRDFTGRAMQRCWMPAPRRASKSGGPPRKPASTAAGESAAVETTGLAVQALLKWGQASATAAQGAGLPRLEEERRGHLGHHAGHHHGAARAAAGHRKGSRRCARHGGDHAQRQARREAHADARRTTTCCTSSSSRTWTPRPPTTVALRFDGKGGLAYQVVGRYFVPWNEKPAAEALSIDVAYDRTRLAQDDIATATATVKNNLAEDRQHGDGGPGNSARVRPADRRPADLPGEERGPQERAPGEIQPDGHAGDPVLRFHRRRAIR